MLGDVGLEFRVFEESFERIDKDLRLLLERDKCPEGVSRCVFGVCGIERGEATAK